MKKYATTLILASTLLIGEVHTFWEKGSQEKENWIINSYQPMTRQWNVKMAAEEVISILYFVAFLLYGKHRNLVNEATVISFIFLAVADMALYFYNFKTYNNFGYVYLVTGLVWIITYWYLVKQKK